MKLRKHKGINHYKITWAQRTPVVVETHVVGPGKTERVTSGGELTAKQAVITTGPNPTATLNAFLFGRDRTNIVAEIWRAEMGFETISHSGRAWFLCGGTR